MPDAVSKIPLAILLYIGDGIGPRLALGIIRRHELIELDIWRDPKSELLPARPFNFRPASIRPIIIEVRRCVHHLALVILEPVIDFGHIDNIRIFDEHVGQIGEVIALMLIGNTFNRHNRAVAIRQAIHGGRADAP